MKRPIKKILVANRGEIAIRVIRACREMNIKTVAIYSEADQSALHIQFADQAFPLGGTKPIESYLNQDKVLEMAKRSFVDAIHPGYGFLSENPQFADKVEKAGIIFIGPSSQTIRMLGDKTAARTLAHKLNVPTVAGTTSPIESEEDALSVAEGLGYPILLKAAAGGGGKGMRIVWSKDEFSSSLRSSRSEAQSAFGDGRVYIEKYVHNPRHVEIQIIADQYNNVVYLGERDCSIQRRHQKVVEESPSPIMDDTLRKKMGESAVDLVKAAKYSNAGTVEFLVDEKRNFFFLEVNTRLQVEHPVTEIITGIDLVKEQIQVASGEALSFKQSDISLKGHAIECRIYAEDPYNNFLPSVGTLNHYSPPEGPNVRVENGVRQGDSVHVFYDPMLSKVIARGNTRSEAIRTMLRSLREFRVYGVATTIPFCEFVLTHDQFVSGEYNTHFVQNYFTRDSLPVGDENERMAVAILAALLFKDGDIGVKTNFNVNQKQVVSCWKKQREETYRK